MQGALLSCRRGASPLPRREAGDTRAARSLAIGAALLIGVACATPPPPFSSLPARPGAIYAPDACCGDPVGYRAPEYPANALNRRQIGWVIVSGILDDDGQVRGATVLASEPVGVFDRAALAAFEQWRYAPPPSPAPDRWEVRVLLKFRTR